MDMAVNPLSKKLYIAVQSADGTPAVLKVDGDKIESVSLKDVNYSSIALNDVVAEDAKDGQGPSIARCRPFQILDLIMEKYW
jgi:hypothetical protein